VMGYAEQSMQSTHASIALAEKLGQPSNRAWAHLAGGIIYHLCRDPVLSLEHWDEVALLSRQHGLTQFSVWAKAWRGWLHARLGCRADGIVELREGLAELQGIETSLTRPQCNALLADLLIENGDLVGAMELITDARAVIEVSGAGYFEAELCRMMGEIHIARQDDEAGEACFRQAIDLSRRRSARSFELRATMSLARLWHKRGKTADARLILGEIYSWFTEGFSTPDLCDARELLDTLA